MPKLPSENLSLQEVRDMQGPVLTYKMDSPCKWEDFRKWPPDIQRDYIIGLERRYNATSAEIARSMGTTSNAMCRLRKELHCPPKLGGRAKPAHDWSFFLAKGESGQKTEAAAPDLPVYPQQSPTVREPIVKIKPEYLPENRDPAETLARLSALLPALKKAGAKIRIEVEL